MRKQKKSQNYETSTEGQYVASADQRVTALFFGGYSFFKGRGSHGCGQESWSPAGSWRREGETEAEEPAADAAAARWPGSGRRAPGCRSAVVEAVAAAAAAGRRPRNAWGPANLPVGEASSVPVAWAHGGEKAVCGRRSSRRISSTGISRLLQPATGTLLPARAPRT
jgi:hypothetical protein